MLHSLYITFATLIFASSVFSIGTLRPFIQLIVPSNSVQGQTIPPALYGVGIEPIDAIQRYSFNLTYPNGTTGSDIGFSLGCGSTSGIIANSTNRVTYTFDNAQAGTYTLRANATYTIFQFNNCTGTSTNYTDSVISSFNVASKNAIVTNTPSEATASLAFPSTYTGFALPYVTGTGQLNKNSTSISTTSAGSRLYATGFVCSFIALVISFIV